MNDLIQLNQLRKQKSQRSLQLLNQNFRKQEVAKDNLLFELIEQNPELTDEQAAQELFGTSPGNRNFRNTKAKLRQRLLNHLHFLDDTKVGATPRDSLFYTLLLRKEAATVLYMEGQHPLAQRYLLECIELAEQGEFWATATTVANMLLKYEAAEGRPRQAEEWHDKAKHYAQQLSLQQAAEGELALLQAAHNKSQSAWQRAADSAQAYADRVEALAAEHGSTHLAVLARKVRLLLLSEPDHTPQRLQVMLQLKDMLTDEQGKFAPIELDTVWFVKALKQDLVLAGKHQEAVKWHRTWDRLFRPGSVEWFDWVKTTMISQAHTGHLTDAVETYRLARTHKGYSLLTEEQQAEWQLHRAMLLWVEDNKLLRWGFPVEEFLVEEGDHIPENHAFKVAHSCLGLLWKIKEGWDQRAPIIVERLAGSVEGLSRTSHSRLLYFGKLLLAAHEKGFDVSATLDRTRSLHQKLEQSAKARFEPFQLETLPYEAMWNQALRLMSMRKSDLAGAVHQ